jgi:hypothetical protein
LMRARRAVRARAEGERAHRRRVSGSGIFGSLTALSRA